MIPATLTIPDYEAADEAQAAANSAWVNLRDTIEQIPARTVDGLRVKASCDFEIWNDSSMMASIVEDIIAMTGGAV